MDGVEGAYFNGTYWSYGNTPGSFVCIRFNGMDCASPLGTLSTCTMSISRRRWYSSRELLLWNSTSKVESLVPRAFKEHTLPLLVYQGGGRISSAVNCRIICESFRAICELHALQIYSRQSPHRILSINPGARAGEFLAMYPELRLQFRNAVKVMDFLARGVSISQFAVARLEDSGFLMKSIIRIRLGAYARPVYFENREVPVRPSHLRQHSCITKCGMSGDPGDGKVTVPWH